MRGLLGLVLFVFSVGAGAVADSYLCVADKATGFKLDKTTKIWRSTNFDVSDNKYIVAKSKFEAFNWDVTTVGEKFPDYLCEDRIIDQVFHCNDISTNFYFSTKTLRFMSVYVGDYVALLGGDGDSTPLIEIGKCSPL